MNSLQVAGSIRALIAPMVADGATAREKVNLIQAEMRKAPCFGRMIPETPIERVELPLKHRFSQGVYARELFIPKGTLVAGEIHKYQNLNIMSQGEMLLFVDDEWITVKPPFTVVSPPNTKRLAYAVEDTVWTTILATHETDIAKIEEHFIAKSDEEYATFAKIIDGSAAKCLS